MISDEDVKYQERDDVGKAGNRMQQPSAFPPAPPLRSSSTLLVFINFFLPFGVVLIGFLFSRRMNLGRPPLKPLPLPPRKTSRKGGNYKAI